MRRILVIGLGGMGLRAVEHFTRRLTSEGISRSDTRIETLILDGDPSDLKRVSHSDTVLLSAPQSLGVACDILGAEALEGWFPYNDPAIRAHELTYSFGIWRRKALLDLMLAVSNSSKKQTLEKLLDRLCAGDGGGMNPLDSYEIYTVASLAGGTGSGAFAPLALYLKKCLLRRDVRDVKAYAVLSLPEIHADLAFGEMSERFYANAYAALTELDVMTRAANGEQTPPFRLGNEHSPLGLLFDSRDPAFAVPSAAPFDGVFLLEKTVHRSIHAHAGKLAEFLYSFLCTPISDAFASGAANRMAVTHGLPLVRVGSSSVRDPLNALAADLSRIVACEALKESLSAEIGANEDTVKAYLDLLLENVNAAVPTVDTACERLLALPACRACGFFDSRRAKAEKKGEVLARYGECLDTVDRYYRIFVSSITESKKAILERIGHASLLSHLATREGKHVEPRQALASLTSLRGELLSRAERIGEAWKDLEAFEPSRHAPPSLLTVENPETVGKSAYLSFGGDRFRFLRTDTDGAYLERRTDTARDGEAIVADAVSILKTMREHAVEQFASLLYKELLPTLDRLIAFYGTAVSALLAEHEECKTDVEDIDFSRYADEYLEVCLDTDSARINELLRACGEACERQDREKAADAIGKVFLERSLAALSEKEEDTLYYSALYGELCHHIAVVAEGAFRKSLPFAARQRKGMVELGAESDAGLYPKLQTILRDLYRLAKPGPLDEEETLNILLLPAFETVYAGSSETLRLLTELAPLPCSVAVSAQARATRLCRFRMSEELSRVLTRYRRFYDAVTENNERNGRTYFDPGLSADIRAYTEG